MARSRPQHRMHRAPPARKADALLADAFDGDQKPDLVADEGQAEGAAVVAAKNGGFEVAAAHLALELRVGSASEVRRVQRQWLRHPAQRELAAQRTQPLAVEAQLLRDEVGRRI